jgi:hypothetical protein
VVATEAMHCLQLHATSLNGVLPVSLRYSDHAVLQATVYGSWCTAFLSVSAFGYVGSSSSVSADV